MNSGTVPATIDRVEIINLTGAQVMVGSISHSKILILPDEEKIINVDIEGDDVLLTREVNLGLLIESKDLIYPLKEELSISSVPSK